MRNNFQFKQFNITLKLLIVTGIILSLLSAPILPGFAKTPIQSKEIIKVGLILTETGIDDMSFNYMAVQGLFRAATDFGIEGAYYTPAGPLFYSEMVQSCITDGNVLCIAVGFGFTDIISAAAVANPTVHFGIIDVSYDSYPDNLRGMIFDVAQASYLAGTLAGLMTTSDVVGTIGAFDIPLINDFLTPYRNGAGCANPDVSVLIDYTNSFTDPDLGSQVAQAQLAQGADVVFPAAGAAGTGALLTTTAASKWAIGVDNDQWGTIFNSGTVEGSEFLLTSAMKKVDNAVYNTIADEVNNLFTSGTVVYDLALDGVGLAPYHEADPSIPQAFKDQVNLVKDGILAGTIDVWEPCWSHQVYLPLILNGYPKLTIWVEQNLVPVMQELATAYETTHPVDVIVEGHVGLRDDFLAAAPAGTGPDIAIFFHDQITQLFREGLLSSINFIGIENDFVQTSLDAVTFSGDRYALPFATQNLALFYNTELVPTPPTSWDELHTIGMALQESMDVTWGFALAGTSYDAYPLMTANGGYVFGKNPDGSWNTGDLGIGGAGMIAFGQLAKDWIDEGFLNPSTNSSEAQNLFKAGEVPWLITGPWALGQIRYSGVPYAIQNFPSGFPFLGVRGFVINSFSTKQTLAASFLTEFMADVYPMTRLYEEGNLPPAYIPVLNTITDPDMAAFGQVAAYAEPMPSIPEMGCVWGPWGNALTFIMAGTKIPTEAYTDAHNQIRDCIDNPSPGMVNVPGSFQSEVGCSGDWDTACALTALIEGTDGLFHGTFSIPAGDYECKVALNGSWYENYGAGGERDGANIPFSISVDGDVSFTYHPDTHILDILVP